MLPADHRLSRWFPSKGQPLQHPLYLDRLGRLLPNTDDLHLGLALPLTVPDGQGQVPSLVALQNVGLSTTPGKDVLQGSGTPRLKEVGGGARLSGNGDDDTVRVFLCLVPISLLYFSLHHLLACISTSLSCL